MSHTIRKQWLYDVIQSLQHCIGRITASPLDAVSRQLRSVVRDLPEPRSAAEGLHLYGVLVQFASQAGDALHTRRSGGRSIRCDALQAQWLAQLCRARPEGIREAFTQWAVAFGTHLIDAHQPAPAMRLAEHLEASYADPLDIAAIARRYRLSGVLLRRQFVQLFGISVRLYLERVRIVHAMTALSETKVEVAARAVGYRSRKNFYRAFFKHTGMTPTQCRALPAAERERLQAVLLDGIRLRDRRTLHGERRVGDRRRAARNAA